MKKSLKSNLIYSIGYQVLIMVVPFIITPYISRVLTPEQLGTYNHANSLAYYFFLFAMLGVNSYGTREVAKVKNDRKKLRTTFWQIYYIQFFGGIIASILYFFLLRVLGLNDFLYFVQIVYLFSVFFDINWLAFGLERFQSISIRNGLVKIASIVLIFLLVNEPSDIKTYGLIMTGGITASLIFVWPIVWKEIGFQVPKMADILYHIKPNALLLIPFLASSVFNYLDSFMLGFMNDIENVAYYTYANSLPNMLLSVTTGVVSVMLSRMSALTVSSSDKSNEIFAYFLKYTTVFNIGLAFGALGVADNFIQIYLGSQYRAALPMFYIMIFTVPINGFVSCVRTGYMIPNGMDQEATKSAILGGIIKLILNFVCMKYMGVFGVCVASVVSYITIVVIQFYYSKGKISYTCSLCHIPYYVVVAFVMLLYLYIVGQMELNIYVEIFIQITGGGLIYLLGVFICMIVTKDSLINMLKRIIVNKKSKAEE